LLWHNQLEPQLFFFSKQLNGSARLSILSANTFPNDTNDEKIVFGDGPDIYGGVAGYYLGTGLSIATGSIFKDENGDEQRGENEAGIRDIGLTLFKDTNGSGVFDPNEDAQLGPTFNTDANGEFRVPGLEDGVYFLILDETDADLPPALEVVPGGNPVMIVIQGNDADGVNFGVISETGPADGVMQMPVEAMLMPVEVMLMPVEAMQMPVERIRAMMRVQSIPVRVMWMPVLPTW